MLLNVDDFERNVNSLRDCGKVTIRLVATTPTGSRKDSQLLHAMLDLCGFRLTGPMPEIDMTLAHRILVSAMHRDMAYGMPAIPLETAASIANDFLATFPAPSRFFTNATFTEWLFAGDATSLVQLSSYSSVTQATLDTGVICLGQAFSGLFWFQDED